VVLRKLGKGSRAVAGRLVRAPRKGSVVVIEFPDGMHEYVTTPVKRVLRICGRESFTSRRSTAVTGSKSEAARRHRRKYRLNFGREPGFLQGASGRRRLAALLGGRRTPIALLSAACSRKHVRGVSARVGSKIPPGG